MLSEGQQIELTIEKAVAGGRMLARHNGQVILVSGAIPGERVKAWVERVEKRLAYAMTRDVVEASPDRRDPPVDPLCGGSLYAHVAYPRQLRIKADVLRDTFARIARHSLGEVAVAASPESGYRMRARFHVRAGRAGFYREGTHQLCDAAATGQMAAGSVEIVQRMASAIEAEAPGAVTEITITESLDGLARAAHVTCTRPADIQPVLQAIVGEGHLRGVSGALATGGQVAAGDPTVSDPLDAILDNASVHWLRRSAASFFQGNRFLLRDLVAHVLAATQAEGPILDLYAGVGLFSVACAAAGRDRIVAIEGDRSSGADLAANAEPFGDRLMTRVGGVEPYLESSPPRPQTVVLDPPRTGLSKPAAAGLLRLAAPRLVYVSCDAPTLARDVRLLLDAGYRLDDVRAFDLFPNTPHVETVAVLTNSQSM